MATGEHRERIYEIFSQPTESVDEKIDHALNVGTQRLGVSIGFFTRIDDGVQEIVRATGDHPLIQPNERCPLDDAYCRRTVEMDNSLAVQNATESTAISETAVETFDLGTYVGAKVLVSDETHGTVCFADEDQRAEPFADEEVYFVELIARLVGQSIERRTYERELAERERQVAEREEVYQALSRACFDFVFRLDQDGRFSYTSAEIQELLGFNAEELEGRPITEVHPDQRTTDRAWEYIQQILDGETIEAWDFPLETSEGRVVYTDIRAGPIYDGGVETAERSPENVVAIQGMARDATERRKRKETIRVINRVLRHNLRNEMGIVAGYAELLEAELDGRLADRAALIGASANRLLDLSESAQRIEDNRERVDNPEPMDLVPVVNRVVEQLADSYPNASIRLEAPETAVARTLPRVEVAVFELVDNAAKHGGDPAAVEVEVEVTLTDREVVLTVSDDGPGLPNTEQRVLTTGEETSVVHGQGLGIWIVNWIVSDIGGDITLTDASDGTTVTVHLPRPS